MKLTIDRSKWLVGENPYNSELLRASDGKMCCLGFYCLAKGATREEMIGRTLPSRLADASVRFPEVDSTEISKSLTLANDLTPVTLGWTIAKRESHVASLFKGIGVDVEFVGEPLP